MMKDKGKERCQVNAMFLLMFTKLGGQVPALTQSKRTFSLFPRHFHLCYDALGNQRPFFLAQVTWTSRDTSRTPAKTNALAQQSQPGDLLACKPTPGAPLSCSAAESRNPIPCCMNSRPESHNGGKGQDRNGQKERKKERMASIVGQF